MKRMMSLVLRLAALVGGCSLCLGQPARPVAGKASTPAAPEIVTTAPSDMSQSMFDQAVDVFRWDNTIQGLGAAYERKGFPPQADPLIRRMDAMGADAYGGLAKPLDDLPESRRVPMRRMVFKDTAFHSEIWRLSDLPGGKFGVFLPAWGCDGRYMPVMDIVYDLKSMAMLKPPKGRGFRIGTASTHPNWIVGMDGTGVQYLWDIETDRLTDLAKGATIDFPYVTWDDKYLVGYVGPQDQATKLSFTPLDGGQPIVIDTPGQQWHGVTLEGRPADWKWKRPLTAEEEKGYLISGDNEFAWCLVAPSGEGLKASRFWNQQRQYMAENYGGHPYRFDGYFISADGWFYEFPPCDIAKTRRRVFIIPQGGECYMWGNNRDRRWVTREYGFSDYGGMPGCPYDKAYPNEQTKAQGGKLFREFLRTRLDGSGATLRICQVGTSQLARDIPFISLGPIGHYEEMNPKAMMSPDGTKLSFTGAAFDQLHRYIVVVKHPEPPAALSLDRKGKAVELSWRKAEFAAETCGYYVYRSRQPGRDYHRLTDQPVADLHYRDTPPDEAAWYYVVTSIDNAGLESAIGSNEVCSDPAGRVFDFYEAEAQQTAQRQYEPPILLGRDPRVRGEHYLMLLGAGPSGYRFEVTAPRDGTYALWARVGGLKASDNNYLKPLETGRQSWRLSATMGRGKQEVELTQEDWHWRQLVPPTELTKGAHGVTVSFSGDGVKVDAFLLTDDPQANPEGLYRIDGTAPDPVGSVAVARENGPHWQKLTWEATKAADLDHYNVYSAREGQAEAKQACLIGSPRNNEWVDFGLKPGTSYSYLVTAVDRWGNESRGSEMAQGKTKDKRLHQVVFEAEAMEGGQGAVVKDTEDTRFASGNACLKLARDQKVTLRGQIDVPADDEYYLWLRMGALKQDANGDWYYNNALAKVHLNVDGKEAAFSKVLLMNRDGLGFYWTGSYLNPRPMRVRLPKGRHELSLRISNEPWVKATGVDMVLLTNDESFWPMPRWQGR